MPSEQMKQAKAERILREMEDSPCACGKRERGDRQELAGPLQVIECLTSTVYRCNLRCTVCGDVHMAGTRIENNEDVER